MSWILGNQIQHNIWKTPHHQAQHPEKNPRNTQFYIHHPKSKPPNHKIVIPKLQTKSPELFIQIPNRKNFHQNFKTEA